MNNETDQYVWFGQSTSEPKWSTFHRSVSLHPLDSMCVPYPNWMRDEHCSAAKMMKLTVWWRIRWKCLGMESSMTAIHSYMLVFVHACVCLLKCLSNNWKIYDKTWWAWWFFATIITNSSRTTTTTTTIAITPRCQYFRPVSVLLFFSLFLRFVSFVFICSSSICASKKNSYSFSTFVWDRHECARSLTRFYI